MTTGLSSDLQNISDIRKTVIINNELLRLQVDIAALQETRLADYGCLKESDYTFYWQGKKEEETREYGVGFAVKNTLTDSVELGSSGTERLLSLRLNTSDGPVNLLSVYAPTLMACSDIKDEFYSQLDSLIKESPKQEPLIILGDFNARVGSDHDAWPTCLGHFGVGKINDNGQRLLEVCSYYNLCITNTFFSTKPGFLETPEI
ncbi:craniofacial development protein 2-like [Amphiura filiformis]|uniref:craniofacial development protein 2-like n=1 Tax=Amphiura filiformis TaxID=82378 RepID=UPI003B20F855